MYLTLLYCSTLHVKYELATIHWLLTFEETHTILLRREEIPFHIFFRSGFSLEFHIYFLSKTAITYVGKKKKNKIKPTVPSYLLESNLIRRKIYFVWFFSKKIKNVKQKEWPSFFYLFFSLLIEKWWTVYLSANCMCLDYLHWKFTFIQF